MSELQKQVEASENHLQRIPLSPPSGALLPQDCYATWKDIASVKELLKGTKPLFPVKSKAWAALTDLNRQHLCLPDQDQVTTFEEKRHLVLVGYNAVSWSIYDRMANICGRLVAINTISTKPQKNPKLVENIMKINDKENVVGVTIQNLILHAYGWPIKVSYMIRNWLVHEGFERGTIKLFDNAPFEISSSARDLIEKEITDDKVERSFSCLQNTVDPWDKGDLIEILEKYHEEIDTMFTSLLKWSTASFVAQIEAFSR